MTYYDLTYRSPMGVVGTHYALLAEDPESAAKESARQLAYGTPWTPEEFTILEVKESTHIPELIGEP